MRWFSDLLSSKLGPGVFCPDAMSGVSLVIYPFENCLPDVLTQGLRLDALWDRACKYLYFKDT